MKMRRFKKGLSLLSIVAMTLSVFSGVMSSATTVKAGAKVSNPRIAEDGTVTWDKITFGSYPQDAEFEAEPIKWRILDIDDEGNAFLLADEALDRKPYNISYTTQTWETCTLRSWLNGTDNYATDKKSFIDVAFTEEEKNAIIETYVVNNDNLSYGTSGGNNTYDKIYLLSIEEASKKEYGFDTAFSEKNEARLANPTDYACINGTHSPSDDNYNGVYWMLRSPGGDGKCEAYVGYNGVGDDYGNNVGRDFTVRPVLHVNLSSSYVTKAGTVTSDGVISINKGSDEYEKPRISNSGITTWDCVYFGKYKQKAKFIKQPIEWRVLSVNGNDAFLVADKGLDCKPYNITRTSVTWETCTLRSWLNGIGEYETDKESFIKSAFTVDEKKAIMETNVVNENNTSYDTVGGNNTTDKIFLLSMAETSKKEYGFRTELKEASKTREVKDTDYACIKGSERSDDTCGFGCCDWWLRSPGRWDDYAMYVYARGSGADYGMNVDYDRRAIRPALHVNLASSDVKYAGTVSANMASEFEIVRAAGKVDEMIIAIGLVTKDSKDKIDVARNSYNALVDEAKEKVKQLALLDAAEKTYADLVKENGDSNSQSINTDNAGGNGQQQTTIHQAMSTQQMITPAPVPQTVAMPAKVKKVIIRNKKKGSFTVSWKKLTGVSGYEVQYASNKKFTKGKKSVTVSKASFTKKKLKRGSKFFVRVRAYNEGSDKKKVYGTWSTTKNVKIKK